MTRKLLFGKRLVSIGLAALMLLAIMVVVFPVQASAEETRTITVYANNPASKTASVKVTANIVGDNKYRINSLMYEWFDVSGNYTIKCFSTNADGTGQIGAVGYSMDLPADVDAIYAQWTTGFEGTEITLHANYAGANPATKKVKADKNGCIILNSSIFPKRPGSMVIGSWATAKDWKNATADFNTFDSDTLTSVRDTRDFSAKKIHKTLYAQWIYRKTITFKDNAGKVLKTQVIDSQEDNSANNLSQLDLYFEGTSGKMAVGFTSKPNGAGDYYLPQSSHWLKFANIPDVFYVQEVPIPNYDYLFFIPDIGRYEPIYSAADIAKLDKKYVIVKLAGGVMPSSTVFGGGMKINYWQAISFDWTQNYEPGVPFSEYARLIAIKAGSRPKSYPLTVFGCTDERPGHDAYTITSVHNPDGSRETTTIKNSDGSVLTLIENRDGSATSTSIMKNGATANTTISKEGEIIVDTTAPLVSWEDWRSGGWIPEDHDAIEISLPKSKLRNRITAYVLSEDGNWYEERKYEPKEYTVRIFSDSYTIKLVPDKVGFIDVPLELWYSGSVDYVVNRGLFHGTTNTSFEPETVMNRAMFASVLWRLENEPESSGNNPFKDVSKDAYYAEAASWANENKIIEGVGAGRFEPNGEISREEIVTIMYRYAKSIGQDIDVEGTELNFIDSEKISSWAAEAMQWAVENEIIQGSGAGGKVDPRGKANRAQVATIMQRFVEKFI